MPGSVVLGSFPGSGHPQSSLAVPTEVDGNQAGHQHLDAIHAQGALGRRGLLDDEDVEPGVEQLQTQAQVTTDTGARSGDAQSSQVAQRVPLRVEQEGGQGAGIRVEEEVGVVLHDSHAGEVGEHGLDAASSPLKPYSGHHVVGGDLAQR